MERLQLCDWLTDNYGNLLDNFTEAIRKGLFPKCYLDEFKLVKYWYWTIGTEFNYLYPSSIPAKYNMSYEEYRTLEEAWENLISRIIQYESSL